jgi:hypothetical protein
MTKLSSTTSNHIQQDICFDALGSHPRGMVTAGLQPANPKIRMVVDPCKIINAQYQLIM